VLASEREFTKYMYDDRDDDGYDNGNNENRRTEKLRSVWVDGFYLFLH